MVYGYGYDMISDGLELMGVKGSKGDRVKEVRACVRYGTGIGGHRWSCHRWMKIPISNSLPCVRAPIDAEKILRRWERTTSCSQDRFENSCSRKQHNPLSTGGWFPDSTDDLARERLMRIFHDLNPALLQPCSEITNYINTSSANAYRYR